MTTRLVAGVAYMLAIAGLSGAAEKGTVPRYLFEPGQELSYRTAFRFQYGEKQNAGEYGSRTEWTVWVVRPNQDGSFRLVIRQEDAFYQTFNGKKNDQPAQKRLVYADVFPDGRVLPNDTIKDQDYVGPIFPKLPKDATEAAGGWSWERDGDKTAAKPVKAKEGFEFETVTDKPTDVIYLSSMKSTYNFDTAKGRVASAKFATTQGYGFKGQGTGTAEFLGAKATDAATLKQLTDEEKGYFESLAAYRKALQAASEKGSEEVAKKLEEAVEALKSVNKALTHPDLKADLEEQIKQQERSAKYTVEAAKRREKVVGKPAEAFETKDIDGKEVKLNDLKGKVVVLDFWYRSCGWCIKAMPQMNGLSEDFAGKQVAIYGMNTDENEEDAKFVIEKMGLKYPTLKAKGLPEKFGVQGFPTLIVIDQQGKVHDLHVGYTPTLREDVGRQIKTLLEKK